MMPNVKNASLQLGGTFMETPLRVCQSIFSLVSRLIASCITILVTATVICDNFFNGATGEKPWTIKMMHGHDAMTRTVREQKQQRLIDT
jgi:hypothetical protein